MLTVQYFIERKIALASTDRSANDRARSSARTSCWNRSAKAALAWCSWPSRSGRFAAAWRSR